MHTNNFLGYKYYGDEIISVEGIDIIFVGPYDLSQPLGVTGETTHPSVIKAVEGIVEKCRKKNMTVGTFVESPKEADFWKQRGVNYLCTSVDVGIFMNASKQMVASMKVKSVV